MENNYIKNPVELKFDPNNISNEEVKEVFQNDLARTFWMGIKPRHATDQYFNMRCLSAADLIEAKGFPKDVEVFGYYLNLHFGTNFDKEFVEELFPYILGKKTLDYEVVSE